MVTPGREATAKGSGKLGLGDEVGRDDEDEDRRPCWGLRANGEGAVMTGETLEYDPLGQTYDPMLGEAGVGTATAELDAILDEGVWPGRRAIGGATDGLGGPGRLRARREIWPRAMEPRRPMGGERGKKG